MSQRIILASQSPRRKELMQFLDVAFEIFAPKGKEIIDSTLPIESAIEQLAYQKAYEVYQEHMDALVIGCDTVVSIDGKVLGKPKDMEQARVMLQMLSARSHQVITGVCLLSSEHKERFHVVSQVKFAILNEADIERYIHTDEPYDKAGGYAIQGKAALMIEGIQGDYYNIMGLPIYSLQQALKRLGYIIP